MIIKRFEVGPLGVNSYLIVDTTTKDAAVIDPGDEPDRIMETIESENLTIKMIILTHAHFDHIGAVSDIKNATKADIVMHKYEEKMYGLAPIHASSWGYQIDPLPPPNKLVEEGDILNVGNLSFKVLHTPGHTPGGICLYGEGAVFTGDTLFRDSVGRTDLPGGDLNALGSSFRRLMDLPPDTKAYCGHGEETTIGREKVSNFFSQQFLH
jgi:hydroxyacylglutathione hydrolase